MISRSAHWIETQEKTGRLRARVTPLDMQRAASIKAERMSKGLRKIPSVDCLQVQNKSHSSWYMKVTNPGGLIEVQQVHSDSEASTSKIHLIAAEIGVKLDVDCPKKSPFGEYGVIK